MKVGSRFGVRNNPPANLLHCECKGPVSSPWGWALETALGRVQCNRCWDGSRRRWGQGHVQLPWGWAPKPVGVRAPCDRPWGWAPQGVGCRAPAIALGLSLTLLGAGPHMIAAGLGPRSCWGQGPVQSPWG